MRRKFAAMLLAVLLLTLTACSAGPKGTELQFLSKDGDMVTAVYDYDAQTITVGGDMFTITAVGDGVPDWSDTSAEDEVVYHYEYDNGDITIVYPNGATYWESSTSYGAVSGWDGDYDTQRYIDGSMLAQHLIQAYEGEKDQFSLTGGMVFGCLLMAAFGAVLAYAPEEVLYLRYQWRFKNVEPTDAAILETRIMGIFFIAVVVVFVLLAIFL